MTASTLADISVVICAYTMDRWAELRAAVESLRRQSAPPRDAATPLLRAPESPRGPAFAMVVTPGSSARA